MRILLTGASGLLGGNFAAVAARAGHEVIGVVGAWPGPAIAGLARQLRLDLGDANALAAAVRAVRPEVVVNCAALSDPAQCDREPGRSAALNVALPRRLAELAAELDARCVQVSSEQVFAGTRAPYRVADPVAPLTLYGRQKVDSERAVREAAPTAAVVRVPLLMGNSPGGRRSVHERLLRDWAEGRVARLFVDEIRQVAMADNVAAEAPQVAFVRPCNLCPHMKRITLPKILDSLVNMTTEVDVDPAVGVRAKAAVERMIHLKN